MDLIFGNPWGALALIGVPVVLAIHMLKVQPKSQRISTLFLFEHVVQESAAGRRLDRLTSSLPMWLQILAVLVATWLLVQPRFMLADTRQRVVFVVDASASMLAFADETLSVADSLARDLATNAEVTEWVLLESSNTSGRLYRGEDRAAFLKALHGFSPRHGAHDVAPALELGRRIGASRGATVFLTDHVTEVPTGVLLRAVGTPVDNIGFTGLRVDAKSGEWSATIKNHADVSARRVWWVDESPDRKTTLEIKARELRVLKGRLPEGASRMTLVLEADRFTFDDRLTIVRPVEKSQEVSVRGRAQGHEMVDRLLAAVNAKRVSGADVTIGAWPRTHTVTAEPGIVWLDAPSKAVRRATKGAFEVGHPLTKGLTWRGLQYRPDKSFRVRDGDLPVLVDADGRALIFRRGPALVVGFDVRRSNAAEWPSFVVLLARHLAELRAAKIGFVRKNVETDQALELAVAGPGVRLIGGGEVSLEVVGGRVRFRAPDVPGPFRVVDDQGQSLAEFGARFADVREADLTKAAQQDDVAAVGESLALDIRSSDPLLELWAFLLLGAMMFSFWLTKEPSR